MRLKGTSSTEFRFELIVKLFKEGKTQKSISELVNCSQAWVSKVLKRHREQGDLGLKVKAWIPKKPSRLDEQQFASLRIMLINGAVNYGFSTDNWTRNRIASLIEESWKVNYHPSHISKIMKKMDFTTQKPKTRSYRKNEQEVQEWKDTQIGLLKKSE